MTKKLSRAAVAETAFEKGRYEAASRAAVAETAFEKGRCEADGLTCSSSRSWRSDSVSMSPSSLSLASPCQQQRYRWHLEKNATQMPATWRRLTIETLAAFCHSAKTFWNCCCECSSCRLIVSALPSV